MSDEYSKPPYKCETGISVGYTWADMSGLIGAELENQYKATHIFMRSSGKPDNPLTSP